MGVPGSGCSRLSLGSGPPRLSGHQAHTGSREQLVALGSAGAALLCQYVLGLCCPVPGWSSHTFSRFLLRSVRGDLEIK